MIEYVARVLYIASTEPLSGKIVLSLGLAQMWLKKGYRVAFVKPITVATKMVDGTPVDESILALKDVLKLEEDVSTISPIVLRSIHEYTSKMKSVDRETVLRTVMEALNKLSDRYDIIIMCGFRSLTHSILGRVFEYELARECRAKVLVLSRFTHEDAVGDIPFSRELCRREGIPYMGCVLNVVKHHLLHKARTDVMEYLSSMEIKVYGVIPELPELTNPTLKELVSHLRGEVLTCPDKIDVRYENILVGAMTPEIAVKYFRAVPNKILITSGDRADLILTALETDVRAVILTGGVHPSSRVITSAESKGVPLILVPYDTYTTLSMIHDLSGKIRIGDVMRIRLCEEVVSKYVDHESILSDLMR